MIDSALPRVLTFITEEEKYYKEGKLTSYQYLEDYRATGRLTAGRSTLRTDPRI